MTTTPLTPSEIAELRREYPKLREDYFKYLETVGWGDSESGSMIYSGPLESDEVYGDNDALGSILLLGDDYQGYCFGYDLDSGCYGVVSDDGEWGPWPASETLDKYVRDDDD